MAQDIEVVWARIVAHEGAEFKKKKGGVFTYKVAGSRVNPSTTNRNLGKSQFEQALPLVPVTSPCQLDHLQGPSYLYAILMDERIRLNDW